MPKRLAAFPAAVCVYMLAPVSSLAQSPVYVRVSPEIGFNHVEHTKVVTDSTGSGSNTTAATGPDFAANLSIGHIGETSGDWLVGGEFQFSVSLRQTIQGSMPATGTGPAGVGQGTWEFSNRLGVGVNLFFGRKLAYRDLRSYLLLGFKRWSTETASGALHPVEGTFTDTNVGERWPWSVGIGITIPRQRRLDIRLRYFRSVTEWGVARPLDSQEPMSQTVEWDYKFTNNGIGLQVGFGTG